MAKIITGHRVGQNGTIRVGCSAVIFDKLFDQGLPLYGSFPVQATLLILPTTTAWTRRVPSDFL